MSADAQELADGMEHRSERMHRVASRQVSAEVREECERQAEEAQLGDRQALEEA